MTKITRMVITHLEPDILECEVKWALESITTNKASGSDGIPVESESEVKSLNHVRLLVTPWTAAYQAPPSMGIPVELFQILKDVAVKMLHSICQKIWKTQ